MTRLARQKGYQLIGCRLYSVNGFYVCSDQLNGRFSAPHSPARYFKPLRYDKIVNFPRRAAPAAANTG